MSVLAALGLSVAVVLAAETIPPRTVVLTFDDAVKSHLEVVAPLLKERGFGATFFVTHAWMNDREHFMSWEEIGRLHEMGFEIGNHSWTHAGFNSPRMAARMAGELALVENELARVGVPKPVSFGWTGNAFGPECVEALRKAGYRIARRGMQPEAPYASLELGALFDPGRHHSLLVPSAGDAYPSWTLEHFKKVVDRAVAGQAAVVQFHGVPDVAHPWVHTSPERFREFMDYLRNGGFRVLAMRDLLSYLPDTTVSNDAMARVQYPATTTGAFHWPTETEQTVQHLDFWLPIMVRDHGFDIEELIQVTALPRRTLEGRVVQLDKSGVGPEAAGRIKVRPYPGGRHPRIGFLEGALDPLRGTKVSLFPPWKEGGYVVLDLPEAIFSNLGLAFLAHTHVPTIWNAQNVTIENVDWQVEPAGNLRSEWRLPNGIRFGAKVTPRASGADLELWLENGTDKKLTEMRTQICLMLKAAPGFNAQNPAGKEYAKPLAVAKAADAARYILVAFERCGRAWGNEKCPCIHSDPVLPDAAPGQRVSVLGRLAFYEGTDVEGAKRRLLEGLRVREGL